MFRPRLSSIVACTLIVFLAVPAPLPAQGPVGPDVWRRFAATLPPGTALKVRLASGQRFKATLLEVLDEAIVLQPRTRTAVPPQRVPFTDVQTLEVDTARGVGLGKAVAVGAAVAAGAWLALMALAFAVWGD